MEEVSEILYSVLIGASDDLYDFRKNQGEYLLWESFSPASAGGQTIGSLNGHLKLKYLPTGIVVEANEFRSMHLNRQLALLKLIIALNG